MLAADHLLAMRTPSQHLVKERAFALTFEDKIDDRRAQRNRDKREITHVIQQQFDLKNQDIAYELPATLGVGPRWRRRQSHDATLVNQACRAAKPKNLPSAIRHLPSLARRSLGVGS